MNRVSHSTWATLLGVLYLGVIVNVFVFAAATPVVLLLMTTDPSLSWPYIALALVPSAPALSAAFYTFRQYGAGETALARAYWQGWKLTWRKAMLVGTVASALATVAIANAAFLASGDLGVLLAPLMWVIAALVATTAVTTLVALAEEPDARVRDAIFASAYLGLKRWYLTVLSVLAAGTQFALFTTMPAIAIGLTTVLALYVIWANSRYALRPVLNIEPAKETA